MSKLTFRLQQLIQRELKKSGIGSYYALAKVINEVSAGPGDAFRVTHRHLSAIAEDPDNTYLTLKLLRALDTYFTQFKEGLRDKPIFVWPGILEPLLRGQAEIVVGSRARLEAGGRRPVDRHEPVGLALARRTVKPGL